MLAENLDNGEYDCSLVAADGTWRVGLASDVTGVDMPQDLTLTTFQRHKLSDRKSTRLNSSHT